ncbi:hypothetical protein [Actinoplanes sp. DH11]|uniref:hypothetical protein n=1 Tax=Actinoplanes sp. DH11 TaxID=2857011 RepID=UPI001E46A470|nr:hypothetical protein [Actinoplanes sp. DH11]
MTPNHDHATLFLAPPARPGVQQERPEAPVDGSAAAMRRLRHPFAVPAEPAPAAARAVHIA